MYPLLLPCISHTVRGTIHTVLNPPPPPPPPLGGRWPAEPSLYPNHILLRSCTLIKEINFVFYSIPWNKLTICHCMSKIDNTILISIQVTTHSIIITRIMANYQSLLVRKTPIFCQELMTGSLHKLMINLDDIH